VPGGAWRKGALRPGANGVTGLGRTTAIALMFAGVGVIGALASILASLLVAPAKEGQSAEPAAETGAPATSTTDAGVAAELAETRAELAATRAELAVTRGDMAALHRLVVAGMASSPEDAADAPVAGG
jgi:hypothetical protein